MSQSWAYVNNIGKAYVLSPKGAIINFVFIILITYLLFIYV